MPPYLPLELQFLILHDLGREHLRRRNLPSTLVKCCLICRAWFPVAQKYLLNSVDLKSDKHMRQLVSRIFNPFEPIKLDIKELNIHSSTEFNENPFHHLVPYHTANRLLGPDVLRFFGCELDGDGDVFPVSTQLTMHLSHFRHVTSLSLHDFRFQTFWDLRRFVLALPVLSFLDLNGVTWPQFSKDLGRVPSLPFIARNLRKINCWRISAAHEVLWFWVTSHKLPSLEHQRIAGSHAEGQYPAFTIKNIVAVGEYLGQIKSTPPLNLEWDYSREQPCCKLLMVLTQYQSRVIPSCFRQD